MDEFEDKIDMFIDDLVRDGYLIENGVDENGEKLYQTTEKFRQDFPDFHKEHIEDTNETLFQLWGMGLIDMTVKPDTNDWVVIPNKKTYTCSLDGLTTKQRNFIRYIRKDKV